MCIVYIVTEQCRGGSVHKGCITVALRVFYCLGPLSLQAQSAGEEGNVLTVDSVEECSDNTAERDHFHPVRVGMGQYEMWLPIRLIQGCPIHLVLLSSGSIRMDIRLKVASH